MSIKAKHKSAEELAGEHFATKILTGELKAGTKLPPERDLAIELEVSRPVIHQALIRLEGQGLVTIVPRRGVYVNDYRRDGKLGLLELIYDLYRERINYDLKVSMLDFIRESITSMYRLLLEGNSSSLNDFINTQFPEHLSEGNDIFHYFHELGIHTNNQVYPMLMNEFKIGIINVGESILASESKKRFIIKLKEIHQSIENKEKEQLISRVYALFEIIKNIWLKEEVLYEQQSGH